MEDIVNTVLRLFIMTVSLLLFFTVMRMLVKRNLTESNSVMWFFIGFIALLLGIFPDITTFLALNFGISYPPTLLFLLSSILLLMIVFKNSIEFSKMEAKIGDIASTLAIMREENRKLKTRLGQGAGDVDESRKLLLVCIPAHNEEENIGTLLAALKVLPIRESFDLLIVDDGSTDNTRLLCQMDDVEVISHLHQMGYGMALVTAYKYAADHRYEYVIQMDADGQHDVRNIEKLYHALTGDPPVDIVIGSRFMEESVSFFIPLYKKFAIAFFCFMIKISTGNTITDPSSGLQGLNRSAFMFCAGFNNFVADYPDANMIIKMLRNRFVIREVPAIMHRRRKGKSMHHGIWKPLKYVVVMIISVLSVWMRAFLNSRKTKRDAK